MIRRHVGASALALLVITAFTGCANTVAGTATWPGAKLDRIVLTAEDFPPGVQYDRLIEKPGQADGEGGPPAMLSKPEGCSDGLTRVIAASAERGAGSAAKYSVAYDGARIVMTVLTWNLDLDKLAATAERCAAVSDVLRPVVGGHSDDHHQTADVTTRRAGVRADDGPQRGQEQRVLLHSKTSTRWRSSESLFPHRIRRSLSKRRCRRRFWTSAANRPSACRPAECSSGPGKNRPPISHGL